VNGDGLIEPAPRVQVGLFQGRMVVMGEDVGGFMHCLHFRTLQHLSQVGLGDEAAQINRGIAIQVRHCGWVAAVDSEVHDINGNPA
jgi:hypothetical protein